MDGTYFSISLKDENSSHGQIVVNQYNVSGGICDTNWDNLDAKMFCRERGYNDGAAYRHITQGMWWYNPLRTVYLLSLVNCTGNESKFSDCDFNTRLSLGNCSTAASAGVICFNDSGVTYNLGRNSSRPLHEGRVEVNIDGIWGTICAWFWDDSDASVFCRQLGQGYNGGYALRNEDDAGNMSKWMSSVACTGDETNLMECPHGGFGHNPDDWIQYYFCNSPKVNAGVSCYGSLRLHIGLSENVGAVEIFQNGDWYYVCDEGFDFRDALVICKEVGYNYGVQILNSAFGNITTSDKIKISNLNCVGTESNTAKCQWTFDKGCSSGMYASVYCSNTVIVDHGLQVRISSDEDELSYLGLLEVNINGVWGAICLDGWTDAAANVTCKQMGFAGGVGYHQDIYGKNIILLSNVTCIGDELFLENCTKSRSPGSCSHYSRRAGVMCYSIGVDYRLVGSNDASKGIMEIQYDGLWGTVCGNFWSWSRGETTVICKQLGFKDGLPVSKSGLDSSNDRQWISYVYCRPGDSSILMCYGSGFNSSFMRYCDEPAAVQCYNKSIEITDVRLSGGNSSAGRVEVYISGPDLWGTVCSRGQYDFSDVEARVICRQLGFSNGKRSTSFGKGTGPTLIHYLECIGNESKIQSCSVYGWSPGYCTHMDDIGVICWGNATVTTTPHTRQTTISIEDDKSTATPAVKMTSQQMFTPSRVTGMLFPTIKPESAFYVRSNILEIAVIVPTVIVAIAMVVACVFWVQGRRRRGKHDISGLIHNEHGPDVTVPKQFRLSELQARDDTCDNNRYDSVEFTNAGDPI